MDPIDRCTWYPKERRQAPTTEDTIALCAFRMEAMAIQIEALRVKAEADTQLHSDIMLILSDLQAMVETRRALGAGKRALAWLGGSIVAVAAAWHSGGDILAHLRGFLRGY